MKKNFEIQKLRVVTDIKQQIVKEENGLVITKVEYYVPIPRAVYNVAESLDTPNLRFRCTGPCIVGSCTGKAVLSEGDKWDLEKGLAISKARAEANAYRQAANRINKIWRRTTSFKVAFTNLVADLDDRADEVIRHNDSYIDSIAGK